MFLLKKRVWLTATLLLTAFLVVKTFPATWVIYAVQKAAPGLQVSGVSGSLWEGRAQYSQWVSNGRSLPLGELSWRLQGLSLLSLSPCINFSTETNAQSIKGDACYSLLGAKAMISDVDIALPIARIAPFFNVDLDGSVDAYIQKASWYKQQLGQTELNVLWQQASLFNGSQWVALGNIQGRARDDNNGGLTSQWNHVPDNQQTPPVDVDLSASVSQLASAKPRLKVLGSVAPSRSSSALKQMLQFIGEPRGDGSYLIDIQE